MLASLRRSLRRDRFSQNRRDVLKSWTRARAMRHGNGARLAQEFADKACSLRLAALLAFCDRRGRRLGLRRRRSDTVLLNARTFWFLIVAVRLSIEQPRQRELVVLLLINPAMFL